MTRFFIKCSFLIALLFVGVLIGMEKANEGMVDMKGYNDSTLQSPVKIHGKSDGNIESSVSGENITSHNLDEKKEHLQNIKAFNLFSSLGKVLSNIVSSLTEKIIDFASSFI
ncbi:hypothetical protein AN964_08275 [Heyndrickxia shackletonii]|uniref:DUF3679 domain-containing protein n=1 Tax=Heyndrickxia shackletonii TaxID=157838 RepID=A0A0Q3WX27_9BACI|nr:DUF3679 domain-containing protein [Heyndrickxia shackletonii]KQL53491.1 hypothetical protein AN964_08275 [Heyndrickxia shackletonii]NEY99565.1 DUF3679 domain-containing protein [Heyndrickxia shackletonii]